MLKEFANGSLLHDLYNESSKPVQFSITLGKMTDLNSVANDSGYLDYDVSGSNVYVVWEENDTTSNPKIFFRASTDSGTTFGKPISISNSTVYSQFPFLFVSGKNVYVDLTRWNDTSLETNIFLSAGNQGTWSLQVHQVPRHLDVWHLELDFAQ